MTGAARRRDAKHEDFVSRLLFTDMSNDRLQLWITSRRVFIKRFHDDEAMHHNTDALKHDQR